jgi:predicted metal-dependent HD superfamily phosphohydrolase
LKDIDELEEHTDIASTPLPGAFDVAAFAWFYHDIVYDVNGSDNELASANLACDAADHLGLSKTMRERTHNAIMSTKHLLAFDPMQDMASGIVADVDLTILGQAAAVYDSYASQIREEYSCYTDIEFAMGRAKVLRSLLKREPLYRTDWFASKYTETAKNNLERELAMLTNR